MTAHNFFQGIDFSGLTKKENEELKKHAFHYSLKIV